MMATVLPLLFGTEGTDECFFDFMHSIYGYRILAATSLLYEYFSGKLSIRSVTSVLLCIMST